MIKVMHVDTVFEVFIFKFFYFGYFFYARRGTYLMMVNFLKTLNPRFRGKVVQKCPIWGHHTQIHDLTADLIKYLKISPFRRLIKVQLLTILNFFYHHYNKSKATLYATKVLIILCKT